MIKTFKLGETLSTARRATGRTLREVASATKISNPYLSQLERDLIAEPSPHKLWTLAKHYGLDYALLWKQAGYPAVDSSVEPRQPMFLGQKLSDHEVWAMAAFLRAYRESR